MKFIKKTFLPSSQPSLNISALCLNNESGQEQKVKNLENELHSEYEQLKSQLKNIKHLSKYQAYFESFESLLDIKNNILGKKFQTLMASLHLAGKKKEKQIPLLEAFLDFSLIEKYKFLIDLIKHVQEHQKAGDKQKLQSPLKSPRKRKQLVTQQSQVKIFSEASINLNQIKTMSLSSWTKVNFELNCQKRELKITGKQSFILFLQNYLVRLSKNQKRCIVLLCCNPEQVPSWLRKVYIQIKKQIFVQVFQGIWNEIIQTQLQKMEASFQDIRKDIQISPTKSASVLSVQEEQFELDKEAYSVFLTPSTIKSYTIEKAKFTTKIKNKFNFFLYKEIYFDGIESESIKQKLQKISLFKASEETNKEIYQVKGYFNIPASVVKFKFIDSLKQRNKFVTVWQILEGESTKRLQAISQSFDFSELFSNESISLNPQIFRIKQLILKEEESNFGNDQIIQILTIQTIKQISKSSFLNFVVVQCEQRKHEKSQLTVTCEFNKYFVRRKIHKLSIDTIPKQKIQAISKKIIENFLKEMILMIFTEQKIYEVTQIQNQQEFFTICEAFNNDIDEFDVFSAKQIQLQQEVAEIQENQKLNNWEDINHDSASTTSQESGNKVKKTRSLDQEEIIQNKVFSMKKFASLDIENQQNQQKQHQHQRLNLQSDSQYSSTCIKTKFERVPKQKISKPLLVKVNLLADEWKRLKEGGLTCINEAKIKEQKQILKKILVKLGENILKQKNVMHVSLPVTIFKTESQLTTVARGLTYAPLLLEPQLYTNSQKTDCLERLKKAVVFLISNSYSQINFQKPFNPILGETVQYWIDGCPAYFEQISHHPPITSYLFIGRGYKIYGSMQPNLSMGINHAKVTSHCIDNIEFDDGTQMNAGANKMLVNGTTFGLRTFNLDQKNYVYDSTNNMLALFSYGPAKKGLFSSSSEPLDYLKGRIMKMSETFQYSEYTKWKNSDYTVKKEWVESEISVFEGIWNKKIFFDSVEYFDFSSQLPFQLIEEAHPLLSDSRYRQDLKWLIKGDLDKSQQHKEKMEEAQRQDRKLRTKKH